MSKKKKRTILFVVACALVLGGWMAYQRQKGKGVPVLAAKVAKEDVVAKVTANGKIQAENKVELSALVMGQIVNLAAHEGDRVTRGQFLLQIDQNRAAAEAAGSSAALRASMSDLDSVKATMKQAELDFERARRNYEA